MVSSASGVVCAHACSIGGEGGGDVSGVGVVTIGVVGRWQLAAYRTIVLPKYLPLLTS